MKYKQKWLGSGGEQYLMPFIRACDSACLSLRHDMTSLKHVGGWEWQLKQWQCEGQKVASLFMFHKCIRQEVML